MGGGYDKEMRGQVSGQVPSIPLRHNNEAKARGAETYSLIPLICCRSDLNKAAKERRENIIHFTSNLIFIQQGFDMQALLQLS